jgi:hypothetical protein
MRALLGCLLGAVASACAHSPLAAADLEQVRRVAIIARVGGGAGPHSTVFRDDRRHQAALAQKAIDAAEGDRRLALVLARGTRGDPPGGSKASVSMSRFEIAALLRAELVSRLGDDAPWRDVLDPGTVARALESFLVQEDSSQPPDYLPLRELGADAVVEVLIEDYGLRGEAGVAGAYLVGTARMFRLGGRELYHRRFVSDELRAGLDGVDPFVVARDVERFTERLRQILLAVAVQVAADLRPPGAPPPAP